MENQIQYKRASVLGKERRVPYLLPIHEALLEASITKIKK
jgi:hypothetical protein